MGGSLSPGLALIFDMDGVVVDSNGAHRETWILFNRRYGLETTEAMLEFMYGRRNDEIVRGFFGEDLPDAEVAARGAAKEQLFRETMAGKVEEHLTAGLLEFLERHRAGPMAVASNAEPANVNFILDQAGLRPYFRAVVDGHQVERPKPYPDIYLRAAELLRTRPADCLVFEDSHSGVKAALAAGMRVAGISSTHAELPGAAVVVDDFLDPRLETWMKAQTRAA
ncbi:MAG TPA: HAD family phosphatase [Bryobacteraceae bacterium]|nr:HAD family phosphatase [Bryobacteraceae bacterium]